MPTTTGQLHEHSLNTALRDVLDEQRSVWTGGEAKIQAERTQQLRSGKRPDIIVEEKNHRPVIVEVELTNEKSAEGDAKARLGETLKRKAETITLALAVVAPKGAGNWDDSEVRDQLRNTSDLRYVAFMGVDPENAERWPKQGWITGTVKDIAQTAKSLGVPNETLKELATEAGEIITDMANDFNDNTGPGTQKNINEVKRVLETDDGRRALRAMGVILLNALLLQLRLALMGLEEISDPRDALDKRIAMGGTSPTLALQWEKILAINYRSIFAPAREMMMLTWDPKQLDTWLGELLKLATKIYSSQLGSMVDVGGELYPRIVLSDRSAAAAYYTNAPVGEMLGWLTIPDDNTIIPDWGDTERVKALRIGDLACGTGTLARAQYRRVRQLHGGASENARNEDIHQALMENGIVGVDISASAAHLTGTGLASMEPSLPYEKSQVGMVRVALDSSIGALDAFSKECLGNLLGDAIRSSESTSQQTLHEYISVPDAGFDVLMMNPPYTRAKKGEEVFNVQGVGPEEREKSLKKWQREIRCWTKRTGLPLKRQAGLGASFTALAHQKMRPGGRLGLVLPMSVSADQTWAAIRMLFARHYDNLIVVNVTNLKEGSLSADTHMGEVLIIGTKRQQPLLEGESNTALFANLTRGPSQFAESFQMAKLTTEATTITDRDDGRLTIGDEQIGTWCRAEIDYDGAPWGAVGAKSGFIALAANQLRNGQLRLPNFGGESVDLGVSMTTLGELVELGPTHDLIGHPKGGDGRGAFEFEKAENTEVIENPSVWATDSSTQKTMLTKATHQGRAVDPEKAKKMMAERSDLVISRSVRWTSQPATAMRTNKPVMGGPAFTTLKTDSEELKAIILLWVNSTLGMIVRWIHGSRQQTGRSRLQVKGLQSMPFPDFTKLPPKKLTLAKELADELAGNDLKPTGMAHCDPARHEINDAVADVLGFSEELKTGIRELTRLWCEEPTVLGNSKKLLKAIGSE